MIELIDTVIGYDKVLARVNYKFATGTTLILGKNGAGKSTLFKTILKQIPLVGGTIKIKGEDITSLSVMEVASRITYLSTHTTRTSFMTGRDYLSLGVANPIYDVIATSKIFELGSYLNHPLNQMSEGQFQKLRVAKALIQSKKIVLLDEPFSFLDPYQKELITEKVVFFEKEHNKTILLVTHDYQLFAEDTTCLFIGKDSFFEKKSAISNHVFRG